MSHVKLSQVHTACPVFALLEENDLHGAWKVEKDWIGIACEIFTSNRWRWKHLNLNMLSAGHWYLEILHCLLFVGAALVICLIGSRKAQDVSYYALLQHSLQHMHLGSMILYDSIWFYDVCLAVTMWPVKKCKEWRRQKLSAWRKRQRPWPQMKFTGQ